MKEKWKGLHHIFQEMGYQVAEKRLPDVVMYSLGRTYHLLSQDFEKAYQKFGLTSASFNLLMLLRHGADPKSFTQNEIGKRLVVTASNMTGLIDRLEKKGLVRRVAGKDRRSKLLQITDKGSQLLEAVWPDHIGTIERFTKVLSDREKEQMVTLLNKLRENYTTHKLTKRN